MDCVHSTSWQEPATLLATAADKRREFWVSIISALLTIAVASGTMAVLDWPGVQLPAAGHFDAAARTD